MPNAASLIEWFAILVVLVALIAAAITDALTYLIPNRYVAAIILAYLVYAIGKPAPFWLHGLAAAAVCFAIGLLLFERVLGGGDVKLLTACALWAGFDQAVLLVFVTALGGGVLALAQLSPLHRLMPAPPGSGVGGSDLRSKLRRPVPYGVAIAIGGVCVAINRFMSWSS
jgi:prepilin peptidase CpaA